MKLSAALATRFSATSYDRRGRGASGDEAEHGRPGARDRRHRGARQRRRRAPHPVRHVLGGRARAGGRCQAGRPGQRGGRGTSRRTSAMTPPSAGRGSGGADRGIRRRGRSIGGGQGVLRRGDRSAGLRRRRDADAAPVARREGEHPTLRYDFALLEGTQDWASRCPRSAGPVCARRTVIWSVRRGGVLPHRDEPGRSAAHRRVRVARGRPPRLPRDVARGDRRAHRRALRGLKTSILAFSPCSRN